MNHRIENRNAGDMQTRATDFESGSQVLLDDGKEDDARMFFDFSKYFVDLPFRPHQRPMVFRRLYAVELNETRAGNAVNGFAGSV